MEMGRSVIYGGFLDDVLMERFGVGAVLWV